MSIPRIHIYIYYTSNSLTIPTPFIFGLFIAGFLGLLGAEDALESMPYCPNNSTPNPVSRSNPLVIFSTARTKS